MKGQILSFDTVRGEGLIHAEDGNRYTFAATEWRGAPHELHNGAAVDFTPTGQHAVGIYAAAGAAGAPGGGPAYGGGGHSHYPDAAQAYGGNHAPYGGNPAPYGGNPAPYGGNPGPYGGNPGPYGGQPPYGGPPPYGASQKSPIVAGLLALFLGQFGAHKFYLGYSTEGAILLGGTIVSFLLAIVLIGFFGLLAIGIICLVEAIIYLTKPQDQFTYTYVLNKKPWF